jgi:hypothetical protein
MKPPIDTRVGPGRSEPTPEDLFPVDRHISVILDEEDYRILETPRDSPSRLDDATPTPLPVAKPVAKPISPPDPRPTPKKNKPKEFLNKLLRTTSATPRPSGSKGESGKWRPTGGGGGRHPIASRLTKEQKLKMINQAVGDFSEFPDRQGSSEFNPVSTGGQRQPPSAPTNAATTHDPESPEVVELSSYWAEPNRPDLNSTRGVEVPNPSEYADLGFFETYTRRFHATPFLFFGLYSVSLNSSHPTTSPSYSTTLPIVVNALAPCVDGIILVMSHVHFAVGAHISSFTAYSYQTFHTPRRNVQGEKAEKNKPSFFFVFVYEAAKSPDPNRSIKALSEGEAVKIGDRVKLNRVKL